MVSVATLQMIVEIVGGMKEFLLFLAIAMIGFAHCFYLLLYDMLQDSSALK